MFQFNHSSDGLEIRIGVASFEACTIDAFRAAMGRHGAQGLRNVVVDLTAVAMIDSSAIGALLGVQKRLADPSDRVTLRGARPAVLTVIELLRLHRVFRIEAAAPLTA